MTLDEQIQYEIDNRGSGRVVSLAYRKQFIEDYNTHGRAFVAKKYNIKMSKMIYDYVQVHTYYLQTYKYPSLCKVLKDMTDSEQMEVLKDFQNPDVKFIDMCLKYHIRFSKSTTNQYIKLCNKFNIAYTVKTYNKYSDAVKLKIADEYNTKGRRIIYELMEEYNIKYSTAQALLESSIELTTGEITDSSLYNVWSDEDKAKIIDDYDNFGVDYIIKTYGYCNENSAQTIVSKFRNELGLLKCNTWDDSSRSQFLDEYNKFGAKYVSEKYNCEVSSIFNMVCTFKLKLGMVKPSQKRHTDAEKREILSFYMSNSIDEAAEKYNVGKSTIYRWHKNSLKSGKGKLA